MLLVHVAIFDRIGESEVARLERLAWNGNLPFSGVVFKYKCGQRCSGTAGSSDPFWIDS